MPVFVITGANLFGLRALIMNCQVYKCIFLVEHRLNCKV